MKRILAIAKLTLRAAFRYRLVMVMAGLLLAAVIVLPLIIKDDGTAAGFTQILLTYTLGSMTALLGFATLWLACGTLARDIEECQMQMVAVKPIARWQIWVGKWLGIMALNLMLLTVCGAAVFVLLNQRVAKLPPALQQKLHSEVLVARGSAREKLPDFEPLVEKRLQERLKQSDVASLDRNFVRKQLREELKSRFQLVPPNSYRVWKIDLGVEHHLLKGQPLFVRARFNASQRSPTGTFRVLWQVGSPEAPPKWRDGMNLAPEAFHEFSIPPDSFDDKGILTILVANPNEVALLFTIEDGLEVLYRQGGFGPNFVRGLGVIFCWLGILAILGLTAASLLSFPVASFVSLAVLLVGLSSGTVSQVVEEGGIMGVDHDTGKVDRAGIIDQVAVPIFKVIQTGQGLFRKYSPIDSLSTGRSVTWTQLAMAAFQIVVLLGGAMSLLGIWFFSRRELASVQMQS